MAHGSAAHADAEPMTGDHNAGHPTSIGCNGPACMHGLQYIHFHCTAGQLSPPWNWTLGKYEADVV